jgi:hypothetical protein
MVPSTRGVAGPDLSSRNEIDTVPGWRLEAGETHEGKREDDADRADGYPPGVAAR